MPDYCSRTHQGISLVLVKVALERLVLHLAVPFPFAVVIVIFDLPL
jgi:hypothetical protein